MSEKLIGMDSSVTTKIHELMQKQDEQINEALGAQVRED